jgi:hypothetical protein
VTIGVSEPTRDILDEFASVGEEHGAAYFSGIRGHTGPPAKRDGMEEVENLATGVDAGLNENAAEIATRLRDLARCVSFRIANDNHDPVPKDLPDIATTPTPVVGGGQRPLANFPPNSKAL